MEPFSPVDSIFDSYVTDPNESAYHGTVLTSLERSLIASTTFCKLVTNQYHMRNITSKHIKHNIYLTNNLCNWSTVISNCILVVRCLTEPSTITKD